MTLELVVPGRFKLNGVINFETSPLVEQQGSLLLQEIGEERWQIDLSGITQADSSALSVCLSWIRLAGSHHKSVCYTGMPDELGALARVCGIQQLLDSVNCLADESLVE